VSNARFLTEAFDRGRGTGIDVNIARNSQKTLLTVRLVGYLSLKSGRANAAAVAVQGTSNLDWEGAVMVGRAVSPHRSSSLMTRTGAGGGSNWSMMASFALCSRVSKAY
jgi:hypothetical protein